MRARGRPETNKHVAIRSFDLHPLVYWQMVIYFGNCIDPKMKALKIRNHKGRDKTGVDGVDADPPHIPAAVCLKILRTEYYAG